MPRLRRIKDYDVTFEAPNEHSEQTDQHSVTNAESQTTFENSNGERSSGESWLSNASIISTFSDEKLRSSINYYRTMARLLQDELTGRLQGTRERSIPHEWNSSPRARDINKVSRDSETSARKLNKTVKAIAQAINAGLTLEEIHSLLAKE